MDHSDFYSTIVWTATIGTTPGYSLENQKSMSVEDFTRIFQKAMEEEIKKSGVWITAVITSSRTVYPSSIGCPPEGEYSYTISGSCNPDFSPIEQYIPALKRVIKQLKEELHQATVLLEISPAHLEYFKED